MKNKIVKKLWQGKYLSVRDYEIEQAIRQGGLKVIHNDKTMELKPEELKTLKPGVREFQSQYKGSYRLVDITFKPLTEDPRQEKLI
tara:strand:+ start:407 stop:664 length:258 start_codon:yes stop_codon:yes gene_type:complete